MKICCRDLLSLPSFEHIRLVGGGGGLNRIVRWPYVTLTNSIDKWVHGGEFMFVSGIGFDTNEDMLGRLLSESNEKRLSGVVILVGSDYIREIPEKAIAIAEEYNLPLFEMPFSIPLVEPTEEISSYIVKSRLDDQFATELLGKILSGLVENEDHLISQAAFYRYNLTGPHRVAVLQLKSAADEERLDIELMLNCQKTADSVFQMHGMNILSMIDYRDIAFLLPVGGVSMDGEIEKLLVKVQTILLQYQPRLGIGRVYGSIREMAKSKSEAAKALKMTDAAHTMRRFEDLGIFRIFFEVTDLTEMEHYCEEVFGTLEKFDADSGTHYMETLEIYIDENCNAIQAAKRLYLHRNSLSYRIKKIENILGCDLSDYRDRLKFRDAFLIRKYLIIAE